MKVHCLIPFCPLIVCLFLCLHAVKADSYCFRVYLKDKGISAYTPDHPEVYLSQMALERRHKAGIAVDASDLPLAHSYIDSLIALGTKPVVVSKWFSTVVVECKDSAVIEQLRNLSIVDSVKWIWKGERDSFPGEPRETSRMMPADKPDEPAAPSVYGYAEKQIKMLNGIPLHEKGYRGKGMTVAVIDAGFMNADRMAAFDSLDIAGVYNVVNPGESVFENDEHGVKTLSCLAANLPGLMVGTAPEATYWLIKSEDNHSEYPIEEDYWTAAVEFADSAGVKVISSSLGYFAFDDTALNYQQSMLDGRTAFISRAAEKAAEKGILLFISAGNEGNGNWNAITFPADARKTLTVGSVTANKEKSLFSSAGFTADVRVKPDIMALGTHCTVIDGSGSITYSNGTSFSTPVAAGLGVCLWQAFPDLSNLQLIDLIQRTSSQYKQPDIELGYGLPDLNEAFRQAQQNAY